MTYSDICKKLGFDPVRDGLPFAVPDHEDDSIPNPFSLLTNEESDFLLDYMIEHREEMKNVVH